MTDRLDGTLLDNAWDFSDPVGSEVRLQALAGRLPKGSIPAAEVETQIARALGLQERFSEGHHVLDDVARVNPRVNTRVLLERGRLFNSAGDWTTAIPLFREAVTMASLADDAYLQVDALHMLAIVDTPRTEQWTSDGLAVVHASDDARVQRWSGALFNNLGWARHDAGQFPAALDAFGAALTAYQVHGTAEQIHIARWSVSRCLRSLGRNREALDILQQLRASGPSEPFVDDEIALLEAPGW